MAFFVSKRSASLQVAGPSGKRYLCSKERPTEVHDDADIINFRSRRDALVETDASGNPVTPAPTHGGTITPADIGLAASYRKFGGAKASPKMDTRVLGEDTSKEPEMKVRRSSPKPVEPPVEPEKEPEPEKEVESEDDSDDIEDSEIEGDEDEDEDGGE